MYQPMASGDPCTAQRENEERYAKGRERMKRWNGMSSKGPGHIAKGLENASCAVSFVGRSWRIAVGNDYTTRP